MPPTDLGQKDGLLLTGKRLESPLACGQGEGGGREYVESLGDWQRQRRKPGLAPYDAAITRTTHDWRTAMQPSSFGEAILASAISDLSRIARKLPLSVAGA